MSIRSSTTAATTTLPRWWWLWLLLRGRGGGGGGRGFSDPKDHDVDAPRSVSVREGLIKHRILPFFHRPCGRRSSGGSIGSSRRGGIDRCVGTPMCSASVTTPVRGSLIQLETVLYKELTQSHITSGIKPYSHDFGATLLDTISHREIAVSCRVGTPCRRLVSIEKGEENVSGGGGYMCIKGVCVHV